MWGTARWAFVRGIGVDPRYGKLYYESPLIFRKGEEREAKAALR